MKAFWACVLAFFALEPIHMLVLDRWSPPFVSDLYWWALPCGFACLTYIFWRIQIKKDAIRKWTLLSGIFLGFYLTVFENTTYLMPNNKRIQVGLGFLGKSGLTDETVKILEQETLDNPHFLKDEKLMELYGNVPGSEKRIWKPYNLVLSNWLIGVSYFFTMASLGMLSIYFFSWIFQGKIKKTSFNEVLRSKKIQNQPN